MRKPRRPLAVLVQPPVYDFALFDLYLKPLGLLRIGRWLEERGWDVRFVDALDYRDSASTAALGKPKRHTDGTGKFHRQRAVYPQSLPPIGRTYARYGILPEVLEGRLLEAVGDEGRLAAAAEGQVYSADRQRAHRSGGTPDAVFVSTGMTYWYPGVEEVCRIVRRTWPGAPLYTGGVYATLLPDHCKKTTGADAVVQGEDYTVLRKDLEKRGLPAPGIEIPEVPLLDVPVWDDASVLRLNRGCPLRCRYCASGLLCGGFVPGDRETVYGWFKRLYRRGVRNFAFYDDALLFRKEEILRPFLEQVEKCCGPSGSVRFYTPNAVHLRYLDMETAVLMLRAGFQEIRIGFESADSGFHDLYDDKFEPAEVKDKLTAVTQAGFSSREVRVYILTGLPGQYAEEAEASVRYAEEAGVRITLARYSPVPGTGLWKESVRKSRYPIAEEPLFHNNTFFPMEWEGFTRNDLNRLQQRVVEHNRGLSA